MKTALTFLGLAVLSILVTSACIVNQVDSWTTFCISIGLGAVLGFISGLLGFEV